ncbi:hypothetical protein F5Y19DRAFT_406989 [Xylariaceae sp. FL1651]|nr:hypothetical protein F5Y19DRAFT_406989 [Xylariaceae sp. FL1651]
MYPSGFPFFFLPLLSTSMLYMIKVEEDKTAEMGRLMSLCGHDETHLCYQRIIHDQAISDDGNADEQASVWL